MPEHFWEDLLIYIEEGKVIPIVGQELLTLPEGPLYRVLAERLAADLKIPRTSLPEEVSLDHVVGSYPPFRDKRASLYPRVKAMLDRLRSPVPEPLRKLVRIAPFRLFVTTTFDSLLLQAVNEERFRGRNGAQVWACSPGHVNDLPATGPEEDDVFIFHLFGRACGSPEYVVTDCDRLEFMHSLQSPASRPKLLFDRLRESHLLFLGTNFPDWLARFFIRLVKSDSLWRLREKFEVVADGRIRGDGALTFFLDHFSQETSVYSEGGSAEFIDRLYDLWRQRHGSPDPGPADEEPVASADAAIPEMPSGAVFVSYASEDRPAALCLCEALEAAGIDVWFDRTDLRGGDAYEAKIKLNIRRCSVFLAMISRHTETDEPRFFRKEWSWAMRRLAEFTGTKRAFVVPVTVDDTRFDAAQQIPEEFHDLHAIRAPQGAPPAALLDLLKSLIRQHRKREQTVTRS